MSLYAKRYCDTTINKQNTLKYSNNRCEGLYIFNELNIVLQAERLLFNAKNFFII